MEEILLCTDEECLHDPRLLGLEGESLEGQLWLKTYCFADEVREKVRSAPPSTEVWVASSSEIEPVNLAATLKSDRPDVRVCLLAYQSGGSLRSRAQAANIDALLTLSAFVQRYCQAKLLWGQQPQAVLPVHNRAAASERASYAGGGGRAVSGESGAEAAGSMNSLCASGGRAKRKEEMPLAAGASVSARTAQSAPAFFMPVISGNGGAGKSTVAVLSALCAQAYGYRTLLVDFDLQFGDAKHLLGRSEAVTIEDALVDSSVLEKLQSQEGAPALLAAPERLERSEFVARQAARLLDEVRMRFDVVIANTGSLWGDQHAVLLERSSKALFLIDQHASSLRACRHALELCARCGIASGPFVFAVNRCSKNALITSLDASCALRGAPAVELQDGGPEVEELLEEGLACEVVSARNALYTSIDALMLSLLPGCAQRAQAGGLSSGKASSRRVGRFFPRKRKDVA